MKNIAINALALAAIISSPISFAQDGDDKGQRRGPPPEAFAACEGLSDGASCSVTTPRNETLQGSCAMPKGDRLVCVPEGHKRGPKQGERPER